MKKAIIYGEIISPAEDKLNNDPNFINWRDSFRGIAWTFSLPIYATTALYADAKIQQVIEYATGKNFDHPLIAGAITLGVASIASMTNMFGAVNITESDSILLYRNFLARKAGKPVSPAHAKIRGGLGCFKKFAACPPNS